MRGDQAVPYHSETLNRLDSEIVDRVRLLPVGENLGKGIILGAA